METALAVPQRAPELCLVHQDVVVVAETVAYLHLAIGVVQVVIDVAVTHGVVAQCVSVVVMERVGTQEVFHRLVMYARVGGELQTGNPSGALAELRPECGCHGNVQVVVVLGLNEVHGIAACCCTLLVGIVQTIPVNLTCFLTAHQVGAGTVEIVVAVQGTSGSIVSVPYVVVA